MIPYLAGSLSGFAVLFTVPMALELVFAPFPGRHASRAVAPRSAVVANLGFAAGWTILGYLPGSALAQASGGALGAATVAAALSVAAYARALFRDGIRGERAGARHGWALLEALLVALGFLVFEIVRETAVGLEP